MPDLKQNNESEPFVSARERPSGAELAAVIVSLAWIAIAAIYFFFHPVEGGNLGLVMTGLIVLLPIALLWVAVSMSRSVRSLRNEAARLQAEERMTAALTGLLLVAGAALAWSVWMYRRTRALAQRDGLTGLANRRTLLAHTQRERVRAMRYQQPVSLVMLDLDLFKQLNDSHGHAAGDRALKHVAELCRQLLRESDVAGRIGGEEFALVLANTDAAGALQLAERLRERLAGSATPDCPAGGLTASFGVAQHQASDATLEIWFARADQALYAAKHGGRNRCSVAEDPAPSGR
jgi:diguanylate cyclase (GGDEF)-like protein